MRTHLSRRRYSENDTLATAENYRINESTEEPVCFGMAEIVNDAYEIHDNNSRRK